MRRYRVQFSRTANAHVETIEGRWPVTAQVPGGTDELEVLAIDYDG
jgi:hypothetical protein